MQFHWSRDGKLKFFRKSFKPSIFTFILHFIQTISTFNPVLQNTWNFRNTFITSIPKHTQDHTLASWLYFTHHYHQHDLLNSTTNTATHPIIPHHNTIQHPPQFYTPTPDTITQTHTRLHTHNSFSPTTRHTSLLKPFASYYTSFRPAALLNPSYKTPETSETLSSHQYLNTHKTTHWHSTYILHSHYHHDSNFY